MKRRTGDPWIPADRDGRLPLPFSVNLIVRDVPRSLAFYQHVLAATVRYSDPDFAVLALKICPSKVRTRSSWLST